MKPLCIDVEVTLHGPKKVPASPFHPDNRVVWWGWTDGTRTHVQKDEEGKKMGVYSTLGLDENDVVIGHNLKFDLHYLYSRNEWVQSQFRTWLLNGGRLWDTLYAEYLLTDQAYVGGRGGGYSLDACCKRWDLPVKPSNLAEKYWSKGVSTEEIPDEEIEPYLQHDVEVTLKLALLQMAEAEKQGRLKYVLNMMDSLMATYLMEAEGIQFDRDQARLEAEAMRLDCLTLDQDILALADSVVPGWDINPASTRDLSHYLFGGYVQQDYLEPELNEDGSVRHYKTGPNKGKPRMKKVTKTIPVPNKHRPEDLGATLTKQGWFQVSEDVLIRALPDPLVERVLEWRKKQKVMKTYLLGYADLAFDGKIRTEFKHHVTPTGRLSSSNPNIQNVK